MNLLEEIGLNIRYYRKKRNMTLDELAEAVCKSKSCVSKYENGKIAMDMITLYDMAKALDVKVTQLLYHPTQQQTEQTNQTEKEETIPTFFQGMKTFYLYYYDGRINQIIRCVADITDKETSDTYHCQMYMNIQDYSRYHQCENVYYGTLTHYTSMSILNLQNQEIKMDRYQLAIPSPYLNTPTKWGLAYGISSRPLMPTSTKLLLSKEIQKETDDFRKSLLISKEDIRLLKLYNMLTIL